MSALGAGKGLALGPAHQAAGPRVGCFVITADDRSRDDCRLIARRALMKAAAPCRQVMHDIGQGDRQPVHIDHIQIGLGSEADQPAIPQADRAGPGMTADIIAITQLLYRYGRLMDAGDFEGAAGLLADARVRLGEGQEMPGSAMAALWRERVILYPCGTPRTQHIITNPIVEVDASGRSARCSSLYTVYQEAPDLPLQIIAGGRYEDAFEQSADGWRFAFRDYTHFSFTGELRHHLRSPAA